MQQKKINSLSLGLRPVAATAWEPRWASAAALPYPGLRSFAARSLARTRRHRSTVSYVRATRTGTVGLGDGSKTESTPVVDRLLNSRATRRRRLAEHRSSSSAPKDTDAAVYWFPFFIGFSHLNLWIDRLVCTSLNPDLVIPNPHAFYFLKSEFPISLDLCCLLSLLQVINNVYLL
jgi:hypothetical protein